MEAAKPGVSVLSLCEKGDAYIMVETGKVFKKEKEMKKGEARICPLWVFVFFVGVFVFFFLFCFPEVDTSRKLDPVEQTVGSVFCVISHSIE